MRPEIQEVLQDKLESFVAEHLNDAAKNADYGYSRYKPENQDGK